MVTGRKGVCSYLTRCTTTLPSCSPSCIMNLTAQPRSSFSERVRAGGGDGNGLICDLVGRAYLLLARSRSDLTACTLPWQNGYVAGLKIRHCGVLPQAPYHHWLHGHRCAWDETRGPKKPPISGLDSAHEQAARYGLWGQPLMGAHRRRQGQRQFANLGT